MKICLINPPVTEKREKGVEYTPNFFTMQHIGLGYLASILEKNGHTMPWYRGIHPIFVIICIIVLEIERMLL